MNYRESRSSRFLAGAEDYPRDRSHSEQTAREIDQEVKRIIDLSLEKVHHILETRRQALVALAERLMEKETIDTAELKEVVETSSPSPMIVPGTTVAGGSSGGEGAKRRLAEGGSESTAEIG